MKKLTLFCLLSLFSTWSFAQRTTYQYLSGTGSDDTVLWDFYCTAGNKSGEWTQIPVPSNWEFFGFGQFTYGHMKAEERINESGIYKYAFSVPEDWKGKKVNIVFEGSMTDTEVKVNGKKAGEMHQGSFYRFKHDISSLVKYGKENLLEVTVHKSSSNESVEGAERRADFWIFGGIFRPVYLEALPKTHIEWTAIDARADGSFNMNVYLNGSYKNTEVTAQVKTIDGKPYGNPIAVQAGKTDSLRLSAIFSNPKLWSAEYPNRYQVEVTLLRNGETLHVVNEKFGFRTAELRPGDGFYVNGAKMKFKGVDRHSHWPTTGRATNYTLNLNDAFLLKEMNMNSVRMSHYPPDKNFLEICDSLGLYVIDELTGWQSEYDTPAGRKLVREMIIRDVNHPCVVMWANGNEGGFNFELVPDYKKYDIQQRLVFHPWLEEANVNTFHYMSWGVGTQFYFEGRKVFFPTEFLHGLYDGGHGAGLDDYWKLMYDHPLSAGGFLWDFADQGVVRNDMDGFIDTDGNHGADGIVGPYREKEGSFYTIKEIWSPVQLEGTTFIPASFDGKIRVQNRYDFTNLKECSFKARWVKFNYPQGIEDSKEVTIASPDVEPGFTGVLKLQVPDNFSRYDALYITAIDPYGKELYTWSRNITSAKQYAVQLIEESKETVTKTDETNLLTQQAGRYKLSIDKVTGLLKEISVNGKMLPLTNGPRFTNERLEVAEVSQEVIKGIEYVKVLYKVKDANRQSNRNMIRIAMLPSGWIHLEYFFSIGGQYDHIGVTFDFPEESVERIKWLGNGPYRVWKNRLKGVTFNMWEKEYNNTVTGESWEYPEFKGFHSNLYAADLVTKNGTLKMVSASDDIYLHLFTPEKPVRRNNDNTLGIFPDGQISFLNGISPVGTKFRPASETGPAGQKNIVVSAGHTDPLTGSIYLKYIP